MQQLYTRCETTSSQRTMGVDVQPSYPAREGRKRGEKERKDRADRGDFQQQ